MRARLLSTLILAPLIGLTACSYGGDPVAGDGETNDTIPALQKAASDALTPRAQRRSYLVTDPGAGRLTPERIHATPSIDGTTLRSARIAPSGDFVTVLKGREDDADQLDLWAYDIESGEGRLLVSSTDLLGGEEELSEEEKNRRERQRLYASGIVSYSWVGDSLLMFPLGGDLYLYDLTTEAARQVTATPAFETDPKVSKDGSLIAYVREDELYVKDLESGLERQLTDSATDVVRNATASFVVQEELDRDTGYWLSPDASHIAYTQIDESPIEIETRANIGPDGITTLDQRYPFAGTDNATVRLGVVRSTGGATTWVDLGEDADIYLTRVAWAPDGETLYAGVLTRNNQTHTVYKVDASNGRSDVFYEETSPTWLNIRSGFKPVEGGFRMISEREGARAYYEITADGAERLTPEGLMVGSVRCTAESGSLLVSGWTESPTSTHLFRVEKRTIPAIDDGVSSTELVTVPITEGDGQHSAAFNADCSRYLGTFSNDNTPSQVRAYEADGTPLTWLSENKLDETHAYAPYLDGHILPEYGTMNAEDGSELHYQLYKPLDLKAGERRASVTIVYGGPGVQRVMNRWQRKHLSRMLAHHGFVVFMVDGRGSSNRGKAFEDVLHRALGRAEVVDQTVGAEWLKGQDFIDPDRMGVYGWSYGGYMALMMLGQTDLYASGVAGAPVTDWALYDTAYTERYLGDPRPDHPNHTPGAYEGGSVFTWLDGLTEPALVIHGMADDNVVFRHTVKLVDSMQTLGRHNLTLEAYPGEKHGFRATEARIHRDRSILEFFLETLDLPEED